MKLKEILYMIRYGHQRLEKTEAYINLQIRNNQHLKWMSDSEIKSFIRKEIKAMYKEAYPDAKPILSYLKKLTT